MEAFTNFLVNNYIWFLLVALILIFALIGYLVDSKPNKKNEVKKTNNQISNQTAVEEKPRVATPVLSVADKDIELKVATDVETSTGPKAEFEPEVIAMIDAENTESITVNSVEVTPPTIETLDGK